MTWLMWTFLFILAVHYAADFLAQPQWCRDNKAINRNALYMHVAIYMAILWAATAWWFESIAFAGLYTAVNGFLHCLTDAITSRITKRLFAARRIRSGFDVIGFDQYLHQLALGGTLIVLIR